MKTTRLIAATTAITLSVLGGAKTAGAVSDSIHLACVDDERMLVINTRTVEQAPWEILVWTLDAEPAQVNLGPGETAEVDPTHDVVAIHWGSGETRTLARAECIPMATTSTTSPPSTTVPAPSTTLPAPTTTMPEITTATVAGATSTTLLPEVERRVPTTPVALVPPAELPATGGGWTIAFGVLGVMALLVGFACCIAARDGRR